MCHSKVLLHPRIYKFKYTLDAIGSTVVKSNLRAERKV